MRDYRGVAIATCKIDCIQRLADRTDLVDLDEDGIRDALVDAFLQALGIGDEQVVANQLNFVTSELGKFLPTFPVIFGEAVLDGNDRIVIRPLRPEARHIFRGFSRLVGLFEDVLAVLIELARGRVESNGNIIAWLVTRL